MAKMFIKNGTSATQIKKRYAKNGTSAQQVKKRYAIYGTSAKLVYNAEFILYKGGVMDSSMGGWWGNNKYSDSEATYNTGDIHKNIWCTKAETYYQGTGNAIDLTNYSTLTIDLKHHSSSETDGKVGIGNVREGSHFLMSKTMIAETRETYTFDISDVSGSYVIKCSWSCPGSSGRNWDIYIYSIILS